jgi:molybdenum cofactor cytidylyltransferase
MTRVAALVLAAGQSRRMGAANKLLVEIEGVAMVARVAAAALESRAETVLVVTGHQAEAVGDALAGMAITLVHNPGHAAGLGTSLAAGLAALPDHIEAVVICLGDMPWIGAAVIDSLIDGFQGQGIYLPTHQGRRGNPVLCARRYFAEMQSIEGDKGARGLIGKYEKAVHEVPWHDDSVLRDVDLLKDAGGASRPTDD